MFVTTIIKYNPKHLGVIFLYFKINLVTIQNRSACNLANKYYLDFGTWQWTVNSKLTIESFKIRKNRSFFEPLQSRILKKNLTSFYL